MNETIWLALSIAIPLLGAVAVSRLSDPGIARRAALVVNSLALFAALIAWGLFEFAGGPLAEIGSPEWPGAWLSVDRLSAPLGSLSALLFLVTTLVTLRTKIRRFSFSATLVAEAITLATLACREPWGVVTLLSLGTIIPWLELRSRKQPVRMYVLHMGAFVVLMVLGQMLEDYEGENRFIQWWASIPLLLAVLIRSGTAPFHMWVTDLFERSSFGGALLYMTPMLGAYAVVRLVVPVSPDWVLRWIALLSLVTVFYTAGLATVQREARRFFCCLFLSHSALVLVGLELMTPLGLTGALCIWISVGLSLAGFGLTLRAVESRRGRLY
ncbi:MAG: proton-conducting transporter membrane subunit, partial [Planctomycetota bacterium]|nr:proton-conducting transporter membrane subunit [Planctomycetota bacterium]